MLRTNEELPVVSDQDLPRFDDHPGAWFGPDMAAHPERWVWQLSDRQVADLDVVVARLDAGGRDIVDLTAADTMVPSLAEDIGRMRHDLLDGIGFRLVRGVPVQHYNVRQAAIAFWCFASQLGEIVPQNAKGHMLGHVRDLGYDYTKVSARAYQTSDLLPFHCDTGGDVVSLLSLRTAKSGGLSGIVSSVTVYDVIADRRPDLARLLMQPTYRDRREEVPEGRGPWYPMPVFNDHEGRMIVSYSRSIIRKAQRFPDVPRITPELEEALDYLDATARDPELRLDMEFRPGDMQFLCNHTTLHSRTGYVDWEDDCRRRHLLRLWTACPDGPALPAYFEEMQGLNADGRPRGLRCPGAVFAAPLVAEDGGAGDGSRRLKDAAA